MGQFSWETSRSTVVPTSVGGTCADMDCCYFGGWLAKGRMMGSVGLGDGAVVDVTESIGRRGWH